MFQDNESIHLRYLMANEQDLLWGLTVNTVGFQSIRKNESYPPRNHPTRYLFSAEKGRVLEEYQLVYIVKGRGSFMSSDMKRVEVKAGNIFLLFPGEWHSYKPDKTIGWDEYWIGFKGANMDNLVENVFFKIQKPVFNIGIQDDIVQLYKQAIGIAKRQKAGFQQMLAGIVGSMLSNTYSLDKHLSFEDLEVTNQINKAKIIMSEKFQTKISPESIAESINMSYSWFRHLFKQYTGFAPNQYILELRIQKCKELLTNTSASIKEIAFDVGFDNSEYFCTMFKRRTNTTPANYRKVTQGVELKKNNTEDTLALP